MTKAFVVDSRPPKAAVIQLNSDSERVEIDDVSAAEITSAAWTNDGETLAIGYANGQVRIKDEIIFSRGLAGADFSEQPVVQLKFSGDNQSMVVVQSARGEENARSDWANAFALRKVEAGPWRVSAQFKHSDLDPIQCADISTVGKRVVTGSSRGRITIWDAEAVKYDEQSEVSVSTASPLEEKKITDRELLTISRLRSAVLSVGFIQKESAVIALETRSPNPVLFPVAKQ